MTPKRSPWFPISQPPDLPGEYEWRWDGRGPVRGRLKWSHGWGWGSPSGKMVLIGNRDQWRGLAEKPE